MEVVYSNNDPMVDENFIDLNKFNKIIQLKSRIDKIIEKGNFEKWVNITKLHNPYENVPFLDRKRRINRAFYKLLEIHKRFNILCPEKKILGFICESPGGFIECSRHVKENEKENFYIAQSLKDSECHFCNKIKDYTKICYGPDQSGDILKVETIKDFIKEVSKYDKCDIVTGDGGFDVSENYIKQEQLSFRIIFCQIVTIIGSLKENGDLVCKIFESYTLPTVELIFILKKYFKHVFIFKPLISRPCNSERYIVAKGFKCISFVEYNRLLDIVKMLETKNIISFGINLPEKFIKKIKTINNSFASDQIESFNKVFDMYDNLYKISEHRINTIIKNNKKKCSIYIDSVLKK